MFTKLISFLLVYTLTTLNFFVFLSPLTFIIISKYIFNITQNFDYIKTFILLIISLINFITLLLLLFDFVFSQSIRKLTKNAIEYNKNDSYKIFDTIFNRVKNKYNNGKVKLYIQNNNAVNAYAVGSLRKKVIILTTGLINFYSSKIKDRNQFLVSIEGIIAHEMSHLVNNDYFTGLLVMINERAVKIASKFVLLFFNIFLKICAFIPFIGVYITNAIVFIYNIFNFFIFFFYKYILLNTYKFIQLKLTRNIEYRADSQAGKVIGGRLMSYTLSLLGNDGYTSIFSTHPLTKNRVKNVENIEISDTTIKPVFISREMLLLTVFLLVILCYLPYKMANINKIIYDYNSMIIFLQNKYMLLNSYIRNILQK